MKTQEEIKKHLERLKKQVGEDEAKIEETINRQYHAANLEIELDLFTLARQQKRELGELKAQIKILEWIIK